jgi:hypothetical protein
MRDTSYFRANLHHPNTEAIKGRCIRTNFHHYILKCIKCPVDFATAVEERNISQLDIKLQGRTLDLPSVIELAPCKYKMVYFYFGVQKKLITYQISANDIYLLLFFF